MSAEHPIDEPQAEAVPSTIKQVFVDKNVVSHPKVATVLQALPAATVVEVDGPLFHRPIKDRIEASGLPSRRGELSVEEYGQRAVEALGSQFHPDLVRFVASVGAEPVGILSRGETCALAKSALLLTRSSTVSTLVKESQRAAATGPDINRVLCCRYTQLNPFSSCPYQCLYCFESDLRGKMTPFMRFYVDYERMYTELQRLDGSARPAGAGRCSLSVNMGEHGDSLAQERIFRILPDVVDWFRGFRNLRLLLLTKGGDASLLPDNPPPGRIALACSINTPATSAALEVDAPSPAERLRMLKTAAEKGYLTAIRLDPLVTWPEETWKADMEALVAMIAADAPANLSEITVGSMRFHRGQAALFKQMFASTRVGTPSGGSYAEGPRREAAMQYLYGPDMQRAGSFSDGYERLPFEARKALYAHTFARLRSALPNIRVSLCQEEERMYQVVPGVSRPGRCNCMVGQW